MPRITLSYCYTHDKIYGPMSDCSAGNPECDIQVSWADIHPKQPLYYLTCDRCCLTKTKAPWWLVASPGPAPARCTPTWTFSSAEERGEFAEAHHQLTGHSHAGFNFSRGFN